LGALIISPTRELVSAHLGYSLRNLNTSYDGPSRCHSFSAGIVIGGKDLKDERDRLSRMNFLVATPGRLLQHMGQTVRFDCDILQMLGARNIYKCYR
jgi:ATP-dependent RNA helicase DDX10/DBP4